MKTLREVIEYLRGGGKHVEPGSVVALEIAALLEGLPKTKPNGVTGMDPGIYEGTGAGFGR